MLTEQELYSGAGAMFYHYRPAVGVDQVVEDKNPTH